MTPHVPPGVLHRELYAWGGLANVTRWDYELVGKRLSEDMRSFGPGMMGWFLQGGAGGPRHPGARRHARA